MDSDFYNTVAKEERGYRAELRAAVNKIINGTLSPARKQEKWNALFAPTMDLSEFNDMVF